MTDLLEIAVGLIGAGATVGLLARSTPRSPVHDFQVSEAGLKSDPWPEIQKQGDDYAQGLRAAVHACRPEAVWLG